MNYKTFLRLIEKLDGYTKLLLLFEQLEHQENEQLTEWQYYNIRNRILNKMCK